MKLLIAIVQDEDAGELMQELTKIKFQFTKLATTGGFLRAGNTTLIMGLEDERLKECLDCIENICKSRKQLITPPIMGGAGEVYLSYPMEVTIGGATVFVLDMEQLIKI